MPEKFGQKLLWVVMNAIFTLVVGFFLLSFTARGQKWLRTERAIEKKADKCYVDQKDGEIRTEISTLKADTERDIDGIISTMNQRFDDQDEKLDIVIKLIEK